MSNMALVKYNNGEPTPEQMKVFASSYTKDEWRLLTRNQKFIDVFPYDLKACRLIAEKILMGVAV